MSENLGVNVIDADGETHHFPTATGWGVDRTPGSAGSLDVTGQRDDRTVRLATFRVWSAVYLAYDAGESGAEAPVDF